MHFGTLLFVAWVGVGLARGQAVRAFEVASVRASNPKALDEPMTAESLRGGRILIRHASLRWLITYAYTAKDYLLSGAPNWLEDKYDLDAKADTPAVLTDAELRPYVRTLLEERMKLAVHREVAYLPVYALTVDQNGPRLHKSAETTERAVKWVSRNKLTARNISMQILANVLSPHPDFRRTVLDETGLVGDFDLTIEWVSDPMAHGDETTRPTPGGTSLATALREQLGLRLMSKKAADEMVVIDHVEKPSQN